MTWADDAVTCVDLDLDVVRSIDGSVFVDDADEFADNQHSLGYPSEVIAQARATAAAVQRAVEADEMPFNRAVAARWIAKLRISRDPAAE